MAKRQFVVKRQRDLAAARAKYLNIRGVPVRIVVREQKTQSIADDDAAYSVIK